MKILLIEDNPGDARLVQEVLKEPGGDFTISVAEKLGLGLEFLLSQEVDVLLLDLGLPDSRGLETLTKVRSKFPSLPVVIMTGSGDEALGVQAVQLGAQDYLVKGQADSGLLRRALLYAIERKRADEALRRAKDELEERVLERTEELAKANELLGKDIVERKRAEEQLKESEKKLRYLSTELMTAQEKERKRIAGELHDSIAASLSAIKLSIEKILSDMEQDKQSQGLREVISKIQQVNEETRRIMSDLRPSVLDDLGIVPAINWFCREFQKIYSSISIEKKIDIEENAVPDSLRTPIFRICQEALNNVARHSKATFVTLSLQKLDNRIELDIDDNGKGFNSEERGVTGQSRKGLGLVSMRERAELSGGCFNIESAEWKGTVICVWWPLK
jgi:signal transduction histidine kinase